MEGTLVYLRDLDKELQQEWIERFDKRLTNAYNEGEDIIIGYYLPTDKLEVMKNEYVFKTKKELHNALKEIDKGDIVCIVKGKEIKYKRGEQKW